MTRDGQSNLTQPQLIHLYHQMVLLRQCELATQKLYKDGKLPGFIHLYIGEEAVAVGACAHLRRDDWITSTHRGHGHALAKGVSPQSVLAELAGKETGCSGGRGGSMHMFDSASGLFGTTGVVGAGLPLAVGLGLSAKVRRTDQVAVCFFGDGTVNHGAFHESVNFAGVLDAPVVFICENNLYGTSTAFKDTTRNTHVAEKAAAYGIPGVAVDGNDVLAVWRTVGDAVARARAGKGPTLVEANTYRHVGHHEGEPLTGTYRTQEEVDDWKQRCPILRFEALLQQQHGVSRDQLDAVQSQVDAQVREAVAFALDSPQPAPATAGRHVFADPINPPMPHVTDARDTVTQGWLEAVRDALAEEMRADPHIIYLGEGIGERGGSWAHTRGLWQEFGGERIIDTPISELGFTGAAIAASASGCRAVSDLLVADFLFDAASQIVDQASKLRYMSNGQISVPVIIRSGVGTIRNAGPHHSGMYHPMWAHVPGLIVAVPSNPADAKGLMKTALRAGDPVIFHEHKSLFSMKGPVPVGEHLVPFGKGAIVREGGDLTIVSCGLLLHHSVKAADALEAEGVSCEVIDLRTIVPLDVELIVASVEKTNRLLVVDESYAMCGIGAEIAAAVIEQAFDALDAPIGRLHTEAVAHPFSPSLENEIVVSVEKIKRAALAVLAGTPRVPHRFTAGQQPEAPRTAPARRVESTVAQSHATPPPGEAAPIDGVSLNMPHQDLTITEATVVRWLKQVGDRLQAGAGVLEVETDKAILEIESPVDGTLAQTLARPGDVIQLGQQVGIIQPEPVTVQ